VRQKSNLLKFLPVSSASASNFCVKFYMFMWLFYLHLNVKRNLIIFKCDEVIEISALPPMLMLEAYCELHPKPKSITELKEALQYSGTAFHRNRSTRQLKASHSDWRDAHKLTVNNSNTQSDCQTSDIIVKYRYIKRKHCVVPVTLFCCVSAQSFFSASENR